MRSRPGRRPACPPGRLARIRLGKWPCVARPGTPFPGRSSLARRARRVNESPRLPLLGGGWGGWDRVGVGMRVWPPSPRLISGWRPRGRRTAGRLKFGAGSQAGLQRGGRPVGEHCRLPASRSEARGSRSRSGGGRSMISESHACRSALLSRAPLCMNQEMLTRIRNGGPNAATAGHTETGMARAHGRVSLEVDLNRVGTQRRPVAFTDGT